MLESRSTSGSTLTKEEEADSLAFLHRDDMNDIANYAGRGRKFGQLSDEELSASFVAVFRKIADNPADWDGRALQKDLECEFALRNKEPPYEQLGEELERFFAAHSEYLKALETENPERWIEMNAEINRDFQQFLTERKNAN